MEFAGEGRSGWANVCAIAVVCSLVAWLFYVHADDPRATTTTVGASPAPVEVKVRLPDKLIVVEATKLPTSPAPASPTLEACYDGMIRGTDCDWTGLPPTSTPPIQDCVEGIATPGELCRQIPVVPTPTPRPTCVAEAMPAATPIARGNSLCTWPGAPAATPG
ncbi:MAG: hypothetical protein K0S99_450 [Thermomicrobiales bacterium]|jgi:hypothetical protein|nr:hypothetical protein [Thermomicrobiales bacterium]